tara:strand:+ start:135 stop:482 length:348 start_codon:yes stop_codon:yes gene_type:complete
MNSKIHRATVTEADVDYIGSITIDKELAEAANISEWEKIDVLNITNGSRLETYVIFGERGSGEICINGAAAHLVNPGDLVILVTYKIVDDHWLTSGSHVPTIIHVDGQNKIINID